MHITTGSADHRTLDSISQRLIIYSLAGLPDKELLYNCHRENKKNKAPGHGCIPADVWKYGS